MSSRTERYEINLPKHLAEKLNALLEGAMYPGVDALFQSMIEWWLNQPSTREKLYLSFPEKYKKPVR